MNDWLSKMCIRWLLIDGVYNYQAEVQNIYDVSCANTNVTVLWVYLYDNTYFPCNTLLEVILTKNHLAADFPLRCNFFLCIASA